MTIATTAAPAADTTTASTTEGVTPEPKQGTESLLTGQDGEETPDAQATEDAMLAGFNRVSGPKRGDDDTTTGGGKELADDDRTTSTSTAQADPATDPEDPEVLGLGMKVSEVKARFGKLDAIEKSLATTSGHVGHLKSLIQTAGKGKPLTKESLTKVREEFGDDYAEALAADLNAAGIGGGATVDEETLSRIVGERVAQERVSMTQEMETRLVRARHKDAADFFQGGKHNADFTAFLGTLPKERQTELAESWDSGVINQALDDFKAHRTKLETDKGKQNRRIDRATAPTTARGAVVAPPSVDPIEAGWNSVKGCGRGNAAVGARR